MRNKEKKRDKRDRSAADADDGSELKHFAQRNKVSLDEARVFGIRRSDPIDPDTRTFRLAARRESFRVFQVPAWYSTGQAVADSSG